MLRRRAADALLRAAARASRPQVPPAASAAGGACGSHTRRCSGAAAAAAAAASSAPKGLLTLAALKRALALTAGGSTAVAAALSMQRPTYVLPPEALAALAVEAAPTALELLPRGVTLVLIFAPLLVLAPLASVLPAARRAWYRLLTWTLGRAGCAFIKWGQWAAVRPDLFPPDMCAALARLHAHVPPHGWAATEREVASAFGAPLAAVFESFEREPLGSGSIAQVYRARLRGDSEDVAVKVRHPGVVQRMRTDFALLAGLAHALERVPALAWLGLVDSLAQFAHAVSAQVRLDAEGANLARLRANFAGCPHVAADFPAPRPGRVTPEVLVESFEGGRPLDAAVAAARAQAAASAGRRAAAALHALHGDATSAPEPEAQQHAAPLLAPHDARAVVRAGNEAYLHMLLVHNFIHADLHPGNILLRERAGAPPVLVLVDAGMVDELTPAESTTFVGLFHAMGAGDGRAAAAALLNFAAAQPATPTQRAAFADSMDRLFKTHCRGFRTGADVGAVLRASLGAVREHGVRIDGRFATAVVNLLCIESFATALDPSYSVLDHSEALLRAHAALGPAALRVGMAAAAPAMAAARYAGDALTWRLPYAARQAWAAAQPGRAATEAAA